MPRRQRRGRRDRRAETNREATEMRVQQIKRPADFAIPAFTMPGHVTVIAEAGINHNGDLDMAKDLIRVAHIAGADAVKFQKRTIDAVYTQEFLDSPRESPFGPTQRHQKEALEFGRAEYDELDAFCRDLGMDWFASAWDLESQKFLGKYKMKYNKIASAMTTNLPFIDAVAAEGKLTYMSTGMCTPDDIDRAVEVFRMRNCPFVLMHTVSTYPAPEADLNLLCVGTLRARYNCPVGYSGHEVAVSPSLIAVMLGAVAVERHITLNRAEYGSDQAASLEVDTFKRLVTMIRKVPGLLGDGVKRVTEGERAVAKKLRYWEDEALLAALESPRPLAKGA
jgi:N-acetylneuraminate synthase